MASSTSTRLARDVRAHIPKADAVPALVRLRPEDAAVWRLAREYLRVRDNDSHTLYAYAIARTLLADVPNADPDVVLPAILLHDTGWSTVADDEVLEAIAPGGGRPDLVRHHEIEGARIAREILTVLDHSAERIDTVTRIIDGHDSRLTALDASDAVVKDADKTWRVTPHGLGIVMGWFSLTRDEALRITAARVDGALFTAPAKALARALIALGSIDVSEALRELDDHV